jgi:hypothetical protein
VPAGCAESLILAQPAQRDRRRSGNCCREQCRPGVRRSKALRAPLMGCRYTMGPPQIDVAIQSIHGGLVQDAQRSSIALSPQSPYNLLTVEDVCRCFRLERPLSRRKPHFKICSIFYPQFLPVLPSFPCLPVSPLTSSLSARSSQSFFSLNNLVGVYPNPAWHISRSGRREKGGHPRPIPLGKPPTESCESAL